MVYRLMVKHTSIDSNWTTSCDVYSWYNRFMWAYHDSGVPQPIFFRNHKIIDSAPNYIEFESESDATEFISKWS